MTRISVITICFNNLDEVLNTSASVDMQTEPPFEHLIINGSTEMDIENHFDQIATPKWRKVFNEPDKGISDAFNKGILKAQGNIIVLLNSGDSLYDENVLKIVSGKFEKDKDLMWLHGRYRVNRNGIWVTLGKPFEASKVYRGMRSVSHQTMYVKKELYDKYGLHDMALKVTMDFDFLVRIRNEKFLFLNDILATCIPEGISTTQYHLSLQENTIVVNRYLGRSFKNMLWTLRLKTLKKIQEIPVLGKWLYRLKVALGLADA